MSSFTILLRVSSCLSGEKNRKLFNYLRYLLSSAKICVKRNAYFITS